jgi:hypothetical protein
MEFWVNASDGMPYFFVTSDINEKMGEMLLRDIVPTLLALHPVSQERRCQMEGNPDEPLFTLVFDREIWSPALFAQLWIDHRIAIITYRKNAKDKWDESLFTDYEVVTSMGETMMQLHEQTCCHEKCTMREVRKLCNEGHQTSIVTTNKMLTTAIIASLMFARWAQENFFRYMRQEYALDKIMQYSVDKLDIDIKVVNQEYTNFSYRIKKEREKLGQRKAKLYQHEQQDNNHAPYREQQGWMKKQLEMIEEIELVEQRLKGLLNKRKQIPYKISLGKMPESIRYNRLNGESKALQNIVKMICYRAETALAAQLRPYYMRANHEIRALIKSIIHTPINMEVDLKNDLLIITLHTLSNQRCNYAVNKICDKVNQTNTIYPSTNLRLFFKNETI